MYLEGRKTPQFVQNTKKNLKKDAQQNLVKKTSVPKRKTLKKKQKLLFKISTICSKANLSTYEQIFARLKKS